MHDDRKPLTAAQRRQAYYAQRRQRGDRLVPIWMTPQTYAKLVAACERRVITQEGVIAHLLDAL